MEGYPFLVIKGFGEGGPGVVFREDVGSTIQLTWVIDGQTMLKHPLTRKELVHFQTNGSLRGPNWFLDVEYDHDSSLKPDPRIQRSNAKNRHRSPTLRMSTTDFQALIDRAAILEAGFERWFKRPPPPDAKALLARWRREAIDTPHRLAIILLANQLTTHDDAIADDRDQLRALIADLCLACEESVKRSLLPQRVAILKRLAPTEFKEIATRYREQHRP